MAAIGLGLQLHQLYSRNVEFGVYSDVGFLSYYSLVRVCSEIPLPTSKLH